MLTQTDTRTAVHEQIHSLLPEGGEETTLTGQEQLHELGLNSLLLARLVAELEETLGVDPFTNGDAELADIRSVDDLTAAYGRALENTTSENA